MKNSPENKFSILIVDDNAKTRESILKMLNQNSGLIVYEADNALNAMGIIHNKNVDLVLMDIMMPEVDGIKASQIIHETEKYQHIPLVFMTESEPTEEVMEKGFESGGIDYLIKPFTRIELLRLVNLYIRFIKRERHINSILEDNNLKLNEEIAKRQKAVLDLKSSEKELKEANRTKDTFFSIIAHDLKNPLGSFKNILQMLVEDFKEMVEEEKFEFITALNNSAKILYQLLENLLDWSRTQTGKLTIEPEAISLRKLSQLSISLLEMNAEKKNIRISNIIPHEVKVFADMNSLRTVIRNLISNAIKFTPEGGNILISAGQIKDNYMVMVKDSGVGMSREDIDKVFRIDTHHTTRGTNDEAGTGLGLILCKEFVEKNKGELWIESDEGDGTGVCFTVPAAKLD